jgi:uncharacterized protein with von Willebrand factor type A (vWA) domain
MRIIKTDPFHALFWRDAKSQSPFLVDLIEKGKQQNPGFEDLAADIFQLLHQPAPTWHKTTYPSIHETLLEDISETKEFKDLKYQADGDLCSCVIGTQVLASRLLEKMSNDTAEKIYQEWQAYAEFEAIEQGNDEPEQYEKKVNAAIKAIATLSAEGLSEKALGELRRAVRSAAPEALNQIEEIAEYERVFEPGENKQAGGSLQSKLDLANRVKQSGRLKKIAELAGRMQRIALAKRRSVVRTNKDELIGVTLGKDLSRTMPTDLALLANAQTRGMFFKKFHENQLLNYDLSGTEVLGKGPFVICVDSTGSMLDDNKETWAKSVALGLLAIAEQEKRDVSLCQFGGSSQELVSWHLPYASNPRAVNRKTIMEFLETFLCAGSTDLESPLLWAAEQIAPASSTQHKADVILLTDGISHFSTDFLTKWKTAVDTIGFSTYAVLIGSLGELPTLKQAIENVAYVSDLLHDDEATNLLFRH